MFCNMLSIVLSSISPCMCASLLYLLSCVLSRAHIRCTSAMHWSSCSATTSFYVALIRFHQILESYLSESYSSYFKTRDSNVSRIHVELQVWIDLFLIQYFGRFRAGSISFRIDAAAARNCQFVKTRFEPACFDFTVSKHFAIK